MKDPAMNPDPEQQRRDDEESRRQSGLEPRPGERGQGKADTGREREDGEDGEEEATAD